MSISDVEKGRDGLATLRANANLSPNAEAPTIQPRDRLRMPTDVVPPLTSARKIESY